MVRQGENAGLIRCDKLDVDRTLVEANASLPPSVEDLKRDGVIPPAPR